MTLPKTHREADQAYIEKLQAQLGAIEDEIVQIESEIEPLEEKKAELEARWRSIMEQLLEAIRLFRSGRH